MIESYGDQNRNAGRENIEAEVFNAAPTIVYNEFNVQLLIAHAQHQQPQPPAPEEDRVQQVVFVQESTLITITVQQWKIVIPQNLSTASWSKQKPKLIYDYHKNALWAGHQHHGWLLYHCVLAGRAGLTVFMGTNMPTHWLMSKVIHCPCPTTVVKGFLLRSEGWLRDAKNRLFDVSNWRWQWHTLIFIMYILIDIWASQCTPIPSPLIVLMHFFKTSYWVCTVSFSSANLLIVSAISSKDTMEAKQRRSPVTSLHVSSTSRSTKHNFRLVGLLVSWTY